MTIKKVKISKKVLISWVDQKNSNAIVSKERLQEICQYLIGGKYPGDKKVRGLRKNWRRMVSSFVLKEGKLFKNKGPAGTGMWHKLIT